MSGHGLLLIPAVTTVRASAALRDSIRLFPDLPSSGDDADRYDARLLREETGSLAGLVHALAESAESIRWGVLAAHHATLSSSALHSAGWDLNDRQAVNATRSRLRSAITPTYNAAAILSDAARTARQLVDELHPQP